MNLMVGRSPFEINAICTCAYSCLYSLYAQAAIGDALYDLIGKALDIPVFNCLEDYAGIESRLDLRSHLRGPIHHAGKSPKVL